jgi:anti-sigma B factor antagonist
MLRRLLHRFDNSSWAFAPWLPSNDRDAGSRPGPPLSTLEQAMRYEEMEIDGVMVVSVHGNILGDESRRRLVDHVRALLMTGHRRLVLDLAGVRHVDSKGLGELIECYSASRSVGAPVRLLGVSGRLADLLVITKLLNVFECFETRDAAVASFRGSLAA